MKKHKNKRSFKILKFLIFLCWSFIVFDAGNFFSNSYLVENYSPSNFLFGKTVIEIDKTYNPELIEDGTKISFDIVNIGDRNIKDLEIYYSVMGSKLEKVDLEKLKLRLGDQQRFPILVPIRINKSCSVYTGNIRADIYEDNYMNCYLDIVDTSSNTCKYFSFDFEVYGNGEKIYQDRLWYPYLDEPVNGGLIIRDLLTTNPLTLTWKDGHKSQCKILDPSSSKLGLTKKEHAFATLLDANTMCLRGDDPSWCKENLRSIE